MCLFCDLNDYIFYLIFTAKTYIIGINKELNFSGYKWKTRQLLKNPESPRLKKK